MDFIWMILIGLVAGFLAGKVMRGGGYGVLGDIIIGVIGALLGGWLFGVLGIWPGGGLIGSLIVAFIGACLLIWLRNSGRGRESRRTPARRTETEKRRKHRIRRRWAGCPSWRR